MTKEEIEKEIERVMGGSAGDARERVLRSRVARAVARGKGKKEEGADEPENEHEEQHEHEEQNEHEEQHESDHDNDVDHDDRDDHDHNDKEKRDWMKPQPPFHGDSPTPSPVLENFGEDYGTEGLHKIEATIHMPDGRVS